MYKNRDGDDGPAELESQFVLRLPIEPARVLREALQNNSQLKDRFSIKIENDMRHGEVRLDHWLLASKVVDLPTIIESLKTIDSKNFYKTADICQMLVCKEEDDQVTTDEESPQKKKKDPNKVDKKYLWPHGIAPPTKNVRRRRFRKTLRKKYVEAPEIEKEVKRLLRIDNDAVSVKWEVINEEDDKVNKGTVIKKELPDHPKTVAEDDIFGGAVSDSEDEDVQLNVLDVIDENSQNSADDSHLSDSNSVMNTSADSKLITEFTSDMFHQMRNSPNNVMQEVDYYQQSTSSLSFSETNLSRGNIELRIDELNSELNDIKMRRIQQEVKIENIENLALRQRFQENLERTLQEQLEKEHEIYELQEIIKQLD